MQKNKLLNKTTRARPIKETPILYGEDARRFLAHMEENWKESVEDREWRLKNYQEVLEMLERGKYIELPKRKVANSLADDNN